MKYAVIENNRVVNIVVADVPMDDNWVASNSASIGDEYVDGRFVTTAADPALSAGRVRSLRNSLLQETDWIVIKSYERGENIPAEWELYRQALRDITQQESFPWAVDWPTQPE
jgi:hypothetical protein